LVVSDDERENTETKLKLVKMPSSNPSSEQRNETLGIGDVAPDWDLKGWSDGKERKIADYRGKVLVLDFWGVWCGPCVRAIPALQALAEKYESKDVVFLGIHTPDGEFDQIGKLKKLRGWTAPSGIDRGTSNADGSTSTTYGISGYPSVLIIDREGKIAFNSGIFPKDRNAFMQETGELAKSIGIAWPLNENAPQSEQEESQSKLMQAMFSREIDRVLE
jgi:thiol-disulfide isomerase/thioredoxin